MKRAVTVCLFGAVMMAVAMGIRIASAQDPATDAEILGRIVQLAGGSGTVDWLVADPNRYEIVLGAGTILPDGMDVTQEGNRLTLYLNAGHAGTFNAEFDIQLHVPPPVDDWTGPLLRISHHCVIKWFVLPVDASPFLNGLGDMVVTPSP